MEEIIQTLGLSKNYGETVVVSDVNLHVRKGEIYGFLGENGTGKSTIMKMIMNLVTPSAGTIKLFGMDAQENHYELLKRIGCIIEEPIFYRKLTVMENMQLHCEYMGFQKQKEIGKALELVNLHGVEKRMVAQLSMGMKQRLAIARAIVTKPELLILDEPINGLDPTGIKEMRTLLLRLRDEFKVTILISSHILSEIEQVATTIGVLANHHLVREVPMHEIRQLEGTYLEVQVDDVKKTGALLDSRLQIHNFRICNEDTLRIYDKRVNKKELLQLLLENQVEVNSIASKEVSLEEYFLDVVAEGKESLR